MDLPQPPSEQELKNIIDKLAQFVARNGPEFEQMTKQKQKDNPKFSFLFGGEFFNYYQYRVTTEQAIIKQKQRTVEQQQAIVQHVVNQQSIQSAPWQQPQPQQSLPDIHEQIRQSEQNLAAQQQLLLQQQQVQVDEAIRKAQDEKLAKLAAECSISIEELDNILQPIIGSCTKDSISSGKGWIFAHATSTTAGDFIIQYILKKITMPGNTFETKLHLVYLINDVLHHCVRKNAEDLKKTLTRLVVPIFCSTSIGAAPEQQQKLHKLYKLWEDHKYFPQQVLEQLQNPVASLASYQANLISEYGSIIQSITTAIQAQYSILQKQHQDFAAHLTNSVHHMQQHPYAFQSSQNPMLGGPPPFAIGQQQQVRPPHLIQAPPPPQPPPIIPQVQQPPQQQTIAMEKIPPQQPQVQPTPQETPPQMSIPHSQPASEDRHSPFVQPSSTDQPMSSTNNVPSHSVPPGPSPHGSGPQSRDYNPSDNIPPPRGPRFMGPRGEAPLHPSRPNGQPPHTSRFADDFSPGFGPPPMGGYMDHPGEFRIEPPHMSNFGHSPRFGAPRGMPMGPLNQHDLPISHHDIPPRHGPPADFMEPMLPPSVPPYYDLPAGLMVPLVKMEDTDYDKPLDPDDIQLPAPALPTERLIAAVELFYSPPSHDRARNSEGWEQLGLYEYFKAKSQAKKESQGILDIPGSGDDNPDIANTEINQEMPKPPPVLENQPPRRRYREFKSPDKNIDLSQEEIPLSKGLLGDHPSRRSRSRSRSRSPPPPRHRSPPRRSSYNRRSPRSRSPSPSDRDRGRDRDRDRDRDRGRKRSPERSPTPPSFFGGAYASNPLDRRLDESNKGHQLLKKMGWSGAGLGATEQGIQDPVDAGDVRDRQDMYKGIGISLNDPYENFRKSKGQAFINRMKARAEELGKM